MRIDELLNLPFFQKCVFKNYFNSQEILGRGDEIENIDNITVEEGEPIKIPSSNSTTGFFLQPNFINVVYCIKKEEK